MTPRPGDGINPQPRHPAIVLKRCPRCSHDSAFDKPLYGYRYRCSRCGHRYNEEKK